MPRWRTALFLTATCVPIPALALAFASSHQNSTPAKPVFQDGQAQIVPAFSDSSQWIRERLWVETEFDSDRNGKRDRVHVDVIRPRQTETEGLKVPVVYESSPYFAGTANGDVNWNAKQELGDEPTPRTEHSFVRFEPNRTSVSNTLTRAWVPRGFAVVHSEAPGTGLSTGVCTVGGDPERLAPKAVIDWLNGRAKGFTTVNGTTEVKAGWCTGKVGMTGTSYNGTMCVAAASTGVKGLEAIIPVAPNTSYYHYYRSYGLVRHPGGYLGEDIDSLYDFINSGDPANREVGNRLYRDGIFAKGQDRKTGDYNAFWAERDLLKHAKNIKCAVLMAHGFNDWNVVPEHSVRISNAVRGRVPLVQYFHQGGHGGDPPFELMNKWFTRYLYGVENGVENGPKAYIVREAPANEPRRAYGPPVAYPDYPLPDSAPVKLLPGSDGTLSLSRTGKAGVQSFTDDVSFGALDLAKAKSSDHRLLFATAPLKEPLHLSGTPQISLSLSSSAKAANLSVYLVQLSETGAELITRGWADPQNADSLKGEADYHSMKPGKPLVPGKFVNLTFDLQPDDQVIPAGYRIGLVILSSDRDFTLWPKPGTKLSVDLDKTKLTLPLVGGPKRFTTVTGG